MKSESNTAEEQQYSARDTLKFLFREGDTFELCGLGKADRAKVTASGWYKQNGTFDPSQFRAYQNIYVTLNPTLPALAGRSCGRLKEGVPRTSDKDIPVLCNLLFDFDPVRPSGIASTAEEHEAAIDLAGKVRDYLTSQGWPEPLFGDSANGAGLIYPLENLENTPMNVDLVKNCIAAIGDMSDTDAVKIDRTVFNPARLVRLFGTMNKKGDSIPERPHRLSKIISVPENRNPVPIEKLRELAAKVKSNNERPGNERKTDASRLDVERYLNHYGVEIVKTKQNGTAILYCLKSCVFDHSHSPNEAAIVQGHNGALSYQCFHNSCKGRTWQEARQVISGNEKLSAFITGTNETEWIPEEPKNLLDSLLKWNDILSLDIQTEYLLQKLIPKGGITLLFGRGGIGKTSLSMQIAHAVAEGLPFAELQTIKMPVFFIDFENPLSILKERVEKIGKSDNLYVWHISNEIQPPRLDSSKWELYKQLPPGLLIVDTLRASHLSDENDSKPIALIMARLKEFREMGFTILLLHHTPKGNENIFKGSTALLDLADHVLGLEEVREGDTIEFDKENLYRLGTRIKTRYDPHHIFLTFNPAKKGFEVAKDPDLEKMKDIRQILIQSQKIPNQTEFRKMIRDEFDYSDREARRLIKKGEDIYWQKKGKGEGKGHKAFCYVQMSDIYIADKQTQQNNTLSDSDMTTPENQMQPLDNSHLSTCQDTPQQMDTTKDDEEGALTHQQMNILEPVFINAEVE
jgi:archaellum biogenesis ATPase FlaH